MNTCKYQYGWTLIEMIIVIAIIAVLASMVITITIGIDNQSRERSLKSAFALLDGALQEYYDFRQTFPDPNESSYPTHSAALYAQLYATPGSKQILEKISDTLIKKAPGADDIPQIYDPWGTILDYRYVSGDTFPSLISAGPDKILGTADDITNR